MEDLRVTLIQSDIIWEDINGNLDSFGKKIDLINNSDLIVMPEMFTTGFSMDVKSLAESENGKAFTWLKEKAVQMDCVVSGSIMLKDEDKGENFNSFVWMWPDGSYGRYDKRHLFRMSDENKNFKSGSERKIFVVNGWRICPLVCYDLRFPVWSRNKGDYDVLLYVANWPASRRYPWETLLKARAIENQAYVVAVNRLGLDGMGHQYSGDSMVIDPKGNVISNTQTDEESVETVSLSYEELENFREKFPAYLDADKFSIEE